MRDPPALIAAPDGSVSRIGVAPSRPRIAGVPPALPDACTDGVALAHVRAAAGVACLSPSVPVDRWRATTLPSSTTSTS